MTIEATMAANDLRERWQDLRRAHPDLRTRDAATRLGVGEAALVATGCGDTVTRLSAADWGDVIAQLPTLGVVTALTRNEHAVHEKTGRYEHVQLPGGARGQVLGPQIDLRLFLSHWHLGFAVVEATPRGPRRSLQFFDRDGTAVHKVFLTTASDAAACDAIVARHRSPDQSPAQPLVPLPSTPAEVEDDRIDIEAFRAGWAALEDTHDFVNLLRRFGVSRTQALRLAGVDMARRVAPSSLRTVLDAVAASGAPIMVFVGNRGVIQIHTGCVQRIQATGVWLNVLDPDFNLHVRADAVAAAWVVRKPTRDGIVTALELYDAAGQTIAILFGQRKPGQPEQAWWRTCLDALPAVGPA
jgi:putative hemin transport protein